MNRYEAGGIQIIQWGRDSVVMSALVFPSLYARPVIGVDTTLICSYSFNLDQFLNFFLFESMINSNPIQSHSFNVIYTNFDFRTPKFDQFWLNPRILTNLLTNLCLVRCYITRISWFLRLIQFQHLLLHKIRWLKFEFCWNFDFRTPKFDQFWPNPRMLTNLCLVMCYITRISWFLRLIQFQHLLLHKIRLLKLSPATLPSV